MTTLTQLRSELKALATPEKATSSAWFFKTGPGQYGEGDQFIGLTVPQQRQVAKKYLNLSLNDIRELLMSPLHEERLTALLILVGKYKQEPTSQKDIYSFYLKYIDRVNNWDLVDSSAPYIVGAYLQDKDKRILARLAVSKSLWERRIAILATLHYIKQGDPYEAFKIADLLLEDKEDLIHKAVGWMLREIGKKSGPSILEGYLVTRYKTMPRTMLRYAIEHFPKERREQYLKGLI